MESLIGTEKQIKWATEIREKVVYWHNYFSCDRDTPINDEEKKYYDLIIQNRDASFWIEARAGAPEGDFEWMYKRCTKKELEEVFLMKKNETIMAIRLDLDLKQQLKIRCAEQNISMQAILSQIIKEYLDKK